MADIKPFENEEDSITIGDLTIENRLDRVSLYGAIEITKDKQGLALAQELKALIDAAVTRLESENLPDHIKLAPTQKVNNPFA